MLKGLRLITILAGFFVFFSTPSHAVSVDLELLLLADVSGSLDDTDFNLQRDGYASAFNSSSVQDSITSGPIGSIAVSLVYWSDSQSVAVPWTLIDDSTSSSAFATSIQNASRPFSDVTGMTAAINYGSTLFVDNGFEGTRWTMDISGDGAETVACNYDDAVCSALQNARNNFLTGDPSRTINALWIDDRDFFGDDAADIINAYIYGSTNVIGGPNAFQDLVQDFSGFQHGIENKLAREIGGVVPEPSTFFLLGAGLAGLGFVVRRRREE